MDRPLVFMFSGQGSQYYQMGKLLYEQNPEFRVWMDRGDNLVYQKLNYSILAILYDRTKRKSDEFSRTLYTHPAIFMVQYALAQALQSEGIYPAKVLGASLGELTAAATSGFLTFEDALNIVIIQAQNIEKFCQPGRMLTILSSLDIYNDLIEINRYITLAADNFPGHFILSGGINELKIIVEWLQRRNITSHMLPITHGFHSSWVDPLRKPFFNSAKNFGFKLATIPFYSCATASMQPMISCEHLWKAIREPILFRQTIQELEQEGPYYYLDVGPSGTLFTFTKYNLSPNSKSKAKAILSPYTQNGDIIGDIVKKL